MVKASPPLAEALRPRTMPEVIGQRHLLGPASGLALRSGQVVCTR
jgi:replication-associated recombination protein RarA